MCKFCENWRTHETVYQTSLYCNLLIGSAMFSPVIVVDSIHKGCPQFADCSAKDREMTVAFQINYCPECGEKLSD